MAGGGADYSAVGQSGVSVTGGGDTGSRPNFGQEAGSSSDDVNGNT